MDVFHSHLTHFVLLLFSPNNHKRNLKRRTTDLGRAAIHPEFLTGYADTASITVRLTLDDLKENVRSALSSLYGPAQWADVADDSGDEFTLFTPLEEDGRYMAGASPDAEGFITQLYRFDSLILTITTNTLAEGLSALAGALLNRNRI